MVDIEADAIAEGVLRLLDDSELARRLGRKGVEAAQSRFGMETMLAAYSALYLKGHRD